MDKALSLQARTFRIGLDSEEAAAHAGLLSRQVYLVLGRLIAELRAQQCTLRDVHRLTFLVTDIGSMGEAYECLEQLNDLNDPPAGSAVVVPALTHSGALVEVECVCSPEGTRTPAKAPQG
ncbi:RidA family protein (plasmid) [Deinococcus taeanensis]|uniref:RidA family protein n=1 Tax=Deinococcus taeanensis TaxID=2737050 RepID=UPI001CDB766E|nr:RidA family protein [Deinococcus taeanensis]UBV45304.1 RidA family protein [Deinococcus taeanensis]